MKQLCNKIEHVQNVHNIYLREVADKPIRTPEPIAPLHQYHMLNICCPWSQKLRSLQVLGLRNVHCRYAISLRYCRMNKGARLQSIMVQSLKMKRSTQKQMMNRRFSVPKQRNSTFTKYCCTTKNSLLDMLSVILLLFQLWRYVFNRVKLATSRIEWVRSQCDTYWPAGRNIVHITFEKPTSVAH